MPKKLTFEKFEELANNKHNGYYKYSKFTYVNARTKGCIICPEHGEFWQTPNCHLQGCGCPKCSHIKRRRTLEDFITTANMVHKGKYNYMKSEYVNDRTEICITCPIHGDFWQKVSYHLDGNGCPLCSIENRSANKEEIIKRASIIHSNKYIYSEVDYKDTNTKVCIICPMHGRFWQTMHSHLRGCGCPQCANKLSNGEDELFEFIKSLCTNVTQRERSIISPYELDIFLPSKQIAIEYNGLAWHSEKFKGNEAKTYHLMKTSLCADKGIRLIHIFEDEWLNKKEIVKSMLRSIICQ